VARTNGTPLRQWHSYSLKMEGSTNPHVCMRTRGIKGGPARKAAAIEYGLIAALIAVVTIAGLTTLGTTLNSRYNAIATDVGS
jgi:pilus assembly protein Flp/PilA